VRSDTTKPKKPMATNVATEATMARAGERIAMGVLNVECQWRGLAFQAQGSYILPVWDCQ